MKKLILILMILVFSGLSSRVVHAVMPPEVYERRERESKIKAIAQVEAVEILKRNPGSGTVQKKATFHLLKPLVGGAVPEVFTGDCYSVMEGVLPPPGGTIYCYPVKGHKVYVAVSDDGGSVTGYSAITEKEEARILDEYKKGDPDEYVLRW